jgi:hypothetical protein
MPLCLAAGAVSATLAIQAFTLAWTHSIEKVRWEEDWQIEGRQLKIVAARIKGSGAGMEPPPEAQLREGVWHYQPAVAPMDRLTLANSRYTAGYELCVEGSCRMLNDYLPATDANSTPPASIDLSACPH